MTPHSRLLRHGFAALALSATPAGAGEFVIQPQVVTESKAVFGRIETRDVIPARSRIGGTLMKLEVTEGDAVKEGQSIANVVDDKFALQLRAAEARVRALASEQGNVLAELERARTLLARGAGTQQRVDQLGTQLEVIRNQIAAAEAEKAVIIQQSAEGDVVAPVSGRVLKVPVTRGAVVMPGEQIALVAGGGFFLRLALPERHAAQLKAGAAVPIQSEAGARSAGKLAKVYPQIENGRVIADVEIDRPGDFFVGARVLAEVPLGERAVLVVPRSAVKTYAGVDFLTLATPSGSREITVVLGRSLELAGVPSVEILSGARAGDRVVVP